MKNMTFIATGDAFVTQRIPAEGYEGFEALRDIIRAHDVGFSNLEMTFHNSEGTPAAVSGGTWAMADPRCLDDMRSYGFNLFTTANNHTGDYGEGGVMATIRHLRERDMVFSGTGASLEEASRACYLESRKGRVALVSACSTFHVSSMAGGQSGSMPGRPGLSPLRFTTTYHVTRPHFDMVKELAKITYVNAYNDYGIKLGYVNPNPEDVTVFGSHRFALAEEDRVETAPLERDMARIEEEVREARRQADVVLVSLHVHETDFDDFAVPPAFLEKAAKRCIDAGASAVIGHGPHELRGVELYRGGLILYSLGNFIFQTETISVQPYEAYANKGLPIDTKVGAYMDRRSKNGTAGYPTQEDIWRSVMASWTMEEDRITQVRFHPISLGMDQPRTRRGTPVPGDEGVLRHLAELSRPFGTEIRIADNMGYIDL
ncbi:MAG: CapA family protein [Oscillospiraceae bacterium]|jgi:poly-gamma-glutamate capsule biosynthesis protein CapA/YwtB (metallophosphatase superfamily)|nr:CapA family protein [Oscillospiraceae bacterium]